MKAVYGARVRARVLQSRPKNRWCGTVDLVLIYHGVSQHTSYYRNLCGLDVTENLEVQSQPAIMFVRLFLGRGTPDVIWAINNYM